MRVSSSHTRRSSRSLADTSIDPSVDFSIPTREELVATLDEIDAELAGGGIVYVHCWAGCGRTGVVVGSWLVRHGVDPQEALRRIAEARGPGCPQTLEQSTFVLDWQREVSTARAARLAESRVQSILRVLE